MRNLLSANFSRLMQSTLFWSCAVITFFSSFSVMVFGILYRDWPLDIPYFTVLPFAGILLAVFTSLFLGTEYSDCTIRNKLTAGYTRLEIYSANLITCVIAAAILTAIWAVCGLIGIPYLGIWSFGVAGYLIRMLVIFCSITAMTAVLTAVAHFISGKSLCSVLSIVLALALIIYAIVVYQALCEPPTLIAGYKYSSDGFVYELIEKPNPKYIDGMMRIVYQIIIFLIPSGQQIWITFGTLEMDRPAAMILFSLIFSAFVSAVGYLAFRRKNIK